MGVQKVNDMLVVLFEDNFYLDVVQQLEDEDTVQCDFMKRHFSNDDLYWSWPSQSDKFSVHKDCVLPVRPNIDIAQKLANYRNIVFELRNVDLIKKKLQSNILYPCIAIITHTAEVGIYLGILLLVDPHQIILTGLWSTFSYLNYFGMVLPE